MGALSFFLFLSFLLSVAILLSRAPCQVVPEVHLQRLAAAAYQRPTLGLNEPQLTTESYESSSWQMTRGGHLRFFNLLHVCPHLGGNCVHPRDKGGRRLATQKPGMKAVTTEGSQQAPSANGKSLIARSAVVRPCPPSCLPLNRQQ